MKISFYVIVMLLVIHPPANSQSLSSAVTQSILIRNELTGAPVDADLNWADANAVKREAVGLYNVTLEPGTGGVLAISRPGYFDNEVTLDYDATKASPTQEITLQPGMPQLHVSVYDQETNRKLATAIDLFTLDESLTAFSETVEVSPFTIDLDYNTAYVLQVRKADYFPVRDTVDFTRVFEGKVKTRVVKLVPLKVGKRITLRNIYFEEDGATLTACARLMLAEVAHMLRERPGMVIEIGIYAGSAGDNASLSESRARAIQTYLIEQGTPSKQLVTKAYRKALHVAANDADENKGLNGRVELKIISIP